MSGPMKSSEFYYPDGNIVVVVQNVEFRLHRSRLARFCDYFVRLPPGTESMGDDENADDEDAGVDDYPMLPVSQCLVTHKLERITLEEFTGFLRALETPLIYVDDPPARHTVLSLLRVADRLGCDVVLEYAKDQLRKAWPSKYPGSSPGKQRPFEESAAIVGVARDYRIPELIKRAFYELLRSEQFWEKADARDTLDLDLTDDDLLALYRTRHMLQQEWRRLVITEPAPGAGCLAPEGATTRCKFPQAGGRRAAVWGQLLSLTGWLPAGIPVAMGSIDGFLRGYLTESLLRSGLWCDACIGERIAAWRTAELQWWDMLDDTLELE